MSIIFDEKSKIFLLQGKSSTYALCIEPDGTLGHRHWGGQITEICDVPTRTMLQARNGKIDDNQEYRAFGGPSLITPAIKATLPDGVRAVFLKYKSHTVEGDTLKIEMQDEFYQLTVTLFYRVCEAFNVIERWSEIKNEGDGDVVLESVYSANWHLPFKDDYRLTYLAGGYNREFNKYQENLMPGRKVLESRDGLSGPNSAPFYMLDGGDATEDLGEVYFGALVWSGNWQFVFERASDNRTLLTGGLSEFDFEVCLEPGQSFEAPKFIGGFCDNGFGGATRLLHRYERAEIIHPSEANRILPVVYNTHSSFGNAVCEKWMLDEIDVAHKSGIELFVIDGGWSGYDEVDSPVNNGQAHRLGFGTWEVNKKRFPNGLKPISDKLHSLGMKLGLWIEPEAVFHTNQIAVEHPEWMLGYQNREPDISTFYYCYSLNMANDDAAEYVTKVMIDLVRENGIDYIKNDFNRYLYHAGWANADRKHQKEVWSKYVRNMWKCYMALKKEFPDLIFENSAAGGKRGDLGMLQFAGRMHRSDNQDPLDSIKIHEGMSTFMPSKFAGGACFISDGFSWFVNDRRTTMEYQAHVAMLSGVSVSLNLAELEPERQEELQYLLALNREIRHTVHLGDMYRLVSAYEKEYGAYEFLEEDKSRAVVFLLGQNMQFSNLCERLRLKDLDPDKKYKVTGHGTYKVKKRIGIGGSQWVPQSRIKEYGTFTGRGLMNVGLHRLELMGHATSQIIIVDEVKE